jgi:uncharacterized membrane protein YidH (DUF202 family)
MDLQEQISLERYKFVTESQKYFTNLAKDTFYFFVKTFISLASGAIALVSLKESLNIIPKILTNLLFAIAVLLSIVGLVSIIQIIFCLKRWYGFRNAEHDLNPVCPKAEWWACIFETMYIFTIIASVSVMWYGIAHFKDILMA